MSLFLYTKKQLLNLYIYNKRLMVYIVRKEWQGKSVKKFKKPFEDYTQAEIKSKLPCLIDRYWIEEKPKKKAKKDVAIKG